MSGFYMRSFGVDIARDDTSGTGVGVGFVGRGRELSDLAGRLSDLGAGRGGMVVVAGEPGIGKSALAEQFGARVTAAGTQLLVGRAVADVGAPSFWPWLRALSGPAATACGLSAEVLGVDGSAYDSAAAARFGAVVRASERLLSVAEPAGVVVILEDLQWADDDTLQLMRYLAGGAELSASRLLVVGTTRDPYRGVSRSWPGSGSCGWNHCSGPKSRSTWARGCIRPGRWPCTAAVPATRCTCGN